MKKSPSSQKSTSPKTVLETILDWSHDRPAWQRDALRRIMAKGRLDNDDVKELIDLCKQGKGGKTTLLKPDPLEKNISPPTLVRVRKSL